MYITRMILDSDQSMKTMEWDRMEVDAEGWDLPLGDERRPFQDDWSRELGDKKESTLEASLYL